MSEDRTTMTDNRFLRQAARWFLTSSALWWVAAIALIPRDDYFVGETARDEAESIAAHVGMFAAFHVVAMLGTAAAAAGVLFLRHGLREAGRSRLLDAAATLALAGLFAWAAEVGVRLTVGVSRAQDVAAGTRLPGDEPAVGSWALFAAAAVGFLAPMLCSWALARRRLPTRRASVVAAAVTTAVTLAALSVLAPSPVYQFGAPALALVLAFAGRIPRTAVLAAGGKGAAATPDSASALR